MGEGELAVGNRKADGLVTEIDTGDGAAAGEQLRQLFDCDDHVSVRFPF
jgi:hypothetical protein